MTYWLLLYRSTPFHPHPYPGTHTQTCSSGTTVVIIVNLDTVYTQPLYLYGEYCCSLIFSPNKSPCKRWKQHISDYWLGRVRSVVLRYWEAVSFPSLLYPLIPACRPADWTEGQRVDLCQNSEDFSPSPPLIFPFRYADSGPPNENMLLPDTICSTCTLYEKIKNMWHHSNETD